MPLADRRRRTVPGLALAVVAPALVATACASPLVTLGTTLAEAALPAGGGSQGQLVAQVVEIDELQRRIRVTTEDGRTGTVLYDQNTLVVREQQHYTVKAIEPGELVLIQVQQDADGLLYATRIDVQPPDETPAVEGPSEADELRRFTGTVGLIDRERLSFVLESTAGDVTVSLPDDPSELLEYFEGIRTGETVHLEGLEIASGRVEVRRFL